MSCFLWSELGSVAESSRSRCGDVAEWVSECAGPDEPESLSEPCELLELAADDVEEIDDDVDSTFRGEWTSVLLPNGSLWKSTSDRSASTSTGCGGIELSSVTSCTSKGKPTAAS